MVEEFKKREVAQSGQVAGYQQVNYSPDSFGAQIGRALQGLGQTLGDVGEMTARMNEEKKANDVMVDLNAAKDQMRPRLFDPDTGIYSRSGGMAMGAGGEANNALTQIQDEYLKREKDPQKRELFSKLWMREAEAVKDKVALHEMNQLGNYKAETAKATLLSSMSDAYNYYNDDEAIAKAKSDAFRAIQVNSAGLPPEALAAAEAEAESQINLAIISRWAAEDPYKALEFYEKNKDAITGKDHITATSLVDAARTNRKAQENAARIQAGGGAATELIYTAMEFAESTSIRKQSLPKVHPALCSLCRIRQGNYFGLVGKLTLRHCLMQNSNKCLKMT
jgi:hypothetical protein